MKKPAFRPRLRMRSPSMSLIFFRTNSFIKFVFHDRHDFVSVSFLK